MEERTARLTLLIDPRKKAAFETLCAREDVTPSQKVRQFIRDYIEEKLGADWLEQAQRSADAPADATAGDSAVKTVPSPGKTAAKNTRQRGG